MTLMKHCLRCESQLHELATRDDVEQDVAALVNSASKEAGDLDGKSLAIRYVVGACCRCTFDLDLDSPAGIAESAAPSATGGPRASLGKTPSAASMRQRPTISDVISVTSPPAASTHSSAAASRASAPAVIPEEEAEESFDRTIRRDSVTRGGALADVGKQLVSAAAVSPVEPPVVIVPALQVGAVSGRTADAMPSLNSGRLAGAVIPSPPASVPVGGYGFGKRPGSRRSITAANGGSGGGDVLPFGVGAVSSVVSSAREDLKRSERSEPIIGSHRGARV